MLKKETLTKIASLLKVKEDDLTKAITDAAEVDITIDEKIATYSEEELNTLKSNEYKKGKTAGVEMEIKDAKEKHGLDFTGKTIEGLLEAKAKKVIADAKIEPNTKVTELEGKVSTLQNTVKEYETKLTEKDAEVTGVKINGELYKHIPAPGEKGPVLGADEIISLMKANGYEFKYENGNTVPYKAGKVLTDKLSEPLKPKDVIDGFLKEKKLIAETKVIDGRGGGDKGGGNGGYGKLSELKAKFKADGKSELGEEFNQAVRDAVKADATFDLQS